jgi:hypothetical protein
MNTTQTKAADTLTCNATAFRTWAELEEALKGGYVPTLRPDDANELALGVWIIQAGYSVWSPLNGGRTYGGSKVA